jgi:predicted ATPase
MATKPSPSIQKLLLREYPELAGLGSTIGVLIGQRPAIERSYKLLGGPPGGIGSAGEDAVHYLAQEKSKLQSAELDAMNEWFRALGVKIDVELRRDAFEVTAARHGGPPVNLADTGAGIAQILPLVVALKVAPPADLPKLLILEQPELDLHPYAHAQVAELLIEAVTRNKGLRLLVETHSDALVLRMRREVAAKRMAPEDVRIYFVEDNSEIPGASAVREIRLNDRGTPDWWPRGVFAESDVEFTEIRRELAKRDGRS